MNTTTPAGTVVIGIGDVHHRDDGAGPEVIAGLRSHHLPATRLAVSGGDPDDVIGLWQGAALAIVVDSERTPHVEPGRTRHLNRIEPIETGVIHAVHLRAVFTLARSQGRLPADVLVYTVQVADTGAGIGLSPAVRSAVRHLTTEIASLHNGWWEVA